MIAAAVVSAIALAIVAVPALLLGYCAGRLQASAPATKHSSPGSPMVLVENDADLALAADTDAAPRLLVADESTVSSGGADER